MGLLSSFTDWELGALMLVTLAIYLLPLAWRHPAIRANVVANKIALSSSLPDFGAVSALLGLAIAALAILIAFPSPAGQPAAYPAHMPLGFLGLFLFLCLLSRSFPGWFTTYLALAFTSSAWYCLAWSIFAIINDLLPDRHWTLVLLAGPICVGAYSSASVRFLLQR